MFGMPAVYAGRRLVACVAEGGLVCRLKRDDVRGRGVTVDPLVINGRASKGWSVVRPNRSGFAHLAPLLERAVVRALAAPIARPRRRRGVR